MPSVAQPTPQLTTPAMQEPSAPPCSHTRGPPLSPCTQEVEDRNHHSEPIMNCE